MIAWLPNRLRTLLAASSYLAAVLALLAGAAWFGESLYGDYAETAELREKLQSFDRRSAEAPKRTDAAAEPQSPLIDGETVTQAGAALQQRMERAVARAGGTLLSSEVLLPEGQGAKGFLSVTADVDLPQAALQPFLYDLEAGMPYLFVDTFAARAQEEGEPSRDPRLRVALSVTGKWGAPR